MVFLIKLERMKRRAAKMIIGLKHLSYKESLRAGTVQPGEEEAGGILSMRIST